MIELNQFKNSAFCLKVRMALAAKQINYTISEITPGIGQVAIFRLSGQRQVPVLVHGEAVISDSSAILHYLEELNPEPALFPKDPVLAAQTHIMEDWADTTLANSARKALLQATAHDPDLRSALLPDTSPNAFKQLIKEVPCEIIGGVTEFIYKDEGIALLESLQNLASLLKNNKWVIGEKLSAADISIAAQLSLLRFPVSSGKALEGKGCPGFTDHPGLESLFGWRDELELHLMSLINEDDKISKNNDGSY